MSDFSRKVCKERGEEEEEEEEEEEKEERRRRRRFRVSKGDGGSSTLYARHPKIQNLQLPGTLQFSF